MTKMSLSIRVRHSSPTTQTVQSLTTAIAQQFAPRQVFTTPMSQPTTSIREATSPSEDLLATIEEVLPRCEPAEAIQQDVTPIKEQLLSSSALNSTLISRQNTNSQECANQISPQNQQIR